MLRYLHRAFKSTLTLAVPRKFRLHLTPLVLGTGSILFCSVFTKGDETTVDDQKFVKVHPWHYKRFTDCASIEFNGKPYMTPMDFFKCSFEVVSFDDNRRQHVTKQLVHSWLRQTPSLSSSNATTFRKLSEKGLISFDEYMFLRSVLTYPRNNLLIAFKMLDRDGSNEVDIEEFSKLVAVFSGQHTASQHVEQELQTTLMTIFFGKDGSRKLRFKDLVRFVNELESELLRIEFDHFSGGQQSMTPPELATVLLRNSKLDSKARNKCLNRVATNPALIGKSIDFASYKTLFNFLNNLDDFTTALRMFVLAKHDITRELFQRAAHAALGVYLDTVVLETIFTLIDADENRLLSPEEIVALMRAHSQRLEPSVIRGLSMYEQFQRCVRKKLSR